MVGRFSQSLSNTIRKPPIRNYIRPTKHPSFLNGFGMEIGFRAVCARNIVFFVHMAYTKIEITLDKLKALCVNRNDVGFMHDII